MLGGRPPLSLKLPGGPPVQRGPVLLEGQLATQPDSTSAEMAMVRISLMADLITPASAYHFAVRMSLAMAAGLPSAFGTLGTLSI